MSVPTRTFFRIVQTNPPTAHDFLSNAVLGRSPRRPLTPLEQELWRGVSVYGTARAAIATANHFPKLGRYVAAVAMATSAQVRIEQTGANVDHYTIWAPADVLLEAVVSITGADNVE